jgi:hypothetical protein
MEDPMHCKLFYKPVLQREQDVFALEEEVNKFLAEYPIAHSFKVAQSMTALEDSGLDSVLLALFYRELPAREG